MIAVTDGSGAVLGVNSYDPYGKPATGNIGRFGYTGQAWLPELGMWYYKARIYNPANTVGRFMQSDPIGYGGGMNLYAYVSGDPVNGTDPTGLDCATVDPLCSEEIVVTARRERAQNSIDGGGGGAGGGAGTGFGGGLGGGGPVKPLPCNGIPCKNLPPEPEPKPKPQSGQNPLCPAPSKSVAGAVADYADKVGFAADGVTASAVIIGLTTAPTGAGPVGAGILAAGAKAVGSVANVVGGVANIVDGNYAAAAGNALAVFAGNGAGRLAARILTRGRMFGTLTTQGERAVQAFNSATSFGVQASMKVGCGAQ